MITNQITNLSLEKKVERGKHHERKDVEKRKKDVRGHGVEHVGFRGKEYHAKDEK